MSIALPEFSSINVLVAGDLMLDRYWSGDTQRISPEAPVPVVLLNGFEERPGGAGNVARIITTLGGSCALAALLGKDDAAKKLELLLKKDNVKLNCISDTSAKTVAKLRILSRHQQLIRLDFEDAFSMDCVEELTKKICDEIERYDALILSDYKKGALRDISKIISKANSMGVKSFIDPKGADFSRYKNATVITPNQTEFTDIVGDVKNERDIAEKGHRLLEELNLTALIITRSEKGVTLIEKSGENINIPARAKEVFDVTGAGDAFISVLAASHVAGSSLKDAVNLANAAASVVVSKLGASTVTCNEIESELNRASQIIGKIISQEELLGKVKNLQGDGKRVVMTNGCFDILHSGHVKYLSKAKGLGDVLIVAVNSDDSVKRLKGSSRPINKITERMTVLSSLQAVDWLVEFDQDTPEELIKSILPDVLVKGGDYEEKDIVGGDLVKGNGGEVKVIDYVKSKSTSEIITRIKQS